MSYVWGEILNGKYYRARCFSLFLAKLYFNTFLWAGGWEDTTSICLYPFCLLTFRNTTVLPIRIIWTPKPYVNMQCCKWSKANLWLNFKDAVLCSGYILYIHTIWLSALQWCFKHTSVSGIDSVSQWVAAHFYQLVDFWKDILLAYQHSKPIKALWLLSQVYTHTVQNH